MKTKFDFKCFNVFDNYYVFDGQSQTAISVKQDTWKVFRDLKEEKLDLNSISEKQQKFISTLLSNFIIQAHKNEENAPVFNYSTNMLSLVHSRRCNLRCQYCFAHEKTKEFDMSIDTAKKAISFFLESFAVKGNKLIVDLTSAGESLVNKDFVIEICKYVSHLRKTTGIDIHPALITNGMLLSEKWRDFFLAEGVFWAISLDGDKQQHERARLGADYDKIIQNYKICKTTTLWYYYGIRATYTAENCNMIDIFESLYKVGFGYPITINPARNESGGYGEFNKKNIKKVLHAYDEFCKYLLDFTLDLDLGRIHSYFSGESYLRKFIGSILHKSKTIYRCSAGIQDIAVDYKGDLYVCTTLSGKGPARMGNINTGLDINSQNNLRSLFADNLPTCSACWARYNCAGSCMAESLNVNGEFGGIIPVKCELTQHLIKLAVYYCHQVYTQRPDILRYIQEKY